MKDYLQWALRQFYLIWFWPTRFAAEIEPLYGKSLVFRSKGARFRYMVCILPCLLVIAVLGTGVFGLIWESTVGPYRWIDSWRGIALGVSLSVAGGVAGGVSLGVSLVIALGVAGGAASGVTSGVTTGVTTGVAVGVAAAVASGVAGEVALVVAGAVAFGVGFGGAVAVVAGGVVGGADGVALGVASGVAVGVAYLLTYFRLATFPFDACWGWFCWDRIQNVFVSAPVWWRRHPLAWNEVIWFPLPRAGKFLARLVRYDRAFGFEKIAFVAAERPLQRRAAQQALVEVALEDFKVASIEQLARVANQFDWLTDSPTELPAELVESAPIFVRISEFITQSRTLQSRFRQLEVLEGADSELEGLRKRLIGRAGRVTPRLLQRANEWNRLLVAERERLSALAKDEGEIPQVFRFGNPVREDEAYVFAGRKSIVRELESVLIGDARPPALLLYGSRRMGKSSILCQLPRLLGPEFVSCTLDCQLPAVRESAPRFFHAVSNALSAGLARRGVRGDPLTLESLRTEPFGVFDDWLQTIERAMPRSLRAFVCFDEYEALHETLAAGWGGRLLDYLRHLQQHRPRFVLVFTGMRTFHALGREWTSRFVSSRSTRVSFLTAEEFRPMLERPVPEFNLRYIDGTLDDLLRLTHGQPFLTQAVAKELVDLMNDEKRHEATPADVERAAQNAMRSGEEYLHNVWDDAEADGQALLTALAQGQPAPLGPTRSHLREMDVLDDEGRFAVPLFECWVIQKKPF